MTPLALAAWAWALLGVAAFLAAGLLLWAVVGAAGAPADGVRRLVQAASLRRSDHRGVELPPEVPEEPDGGREPGAESAPGPPQRRS
jgi:hypothetical protein